MSFVSHTNFSIAASAGINELQRMSDVHSFSGMPILLRQAEIKSSWRALEFDFLFLFACGFVASGAAPKNTAIFLAASGSRMKFTINKSSGRSEKCCIVLKWWLFLRLTHDCSDDSSVVQSSDIIFFRSGGRLSMCSIRLAIHVSKSRTWRMNLEFGYCLSNSTKSTGTHRKMRQKTNGTTLI